MFYASYLLVMIVVVALRILFPEARMALFLIISIYHFGQADMEDFLMRQEPLNRIFYINRGLLIIGLIVFSDPLTTYPIITTTMQFDTVIFSNLMPSANVSLLVIIGTYFLISIPALITGRIENTATFIVDSLLLTLFLLITGPLIGFAIYFALWHSAGHINEMREFFEERGKSFSVGRFYKKATPFTIVSIIVLALLFLINVQLTRISHQEILSSARRR